METTYLMRHWIIRKDREDEDAQERWKDATNTVQGEFIDAGTRSM